MNFYCSSKPNVKREGFCKFIDISLFRISKFYERQHKTAFKAPSKIITYARVVCLSIVSGYFKYCIFGVFLDPPGIVSDIVKHPIFLNFGLIVNLAVI